ncbi:hypothetical protein Msi02_14600 [Microbispora siamensis]|uniref:Uncharacterized protein n=1 Tax=Microbispora siamensis TaxID=564413 RepID=A0ABQ4GGT8_9ACTN|nr:hypothetical protein Msi02_14600 [Microbispora siamensis]
MSANFLVPIRIEVPEGRYITGRKMKEHMKHLLIAALIGAGLVAGASVVVPDHHVQAIADLFPDPVGSCC